MSSSIDISRDESSPDEGAIRLDLQNMLIVGSAGAWERRSRSFSFGRELSWQGERYPESLPSQSKQPNYDEMEATLAEIRATLLHVSSSLDDVKADVREQRSDMKDVRADMNAEFKAVRSEIGAVSTGVGTLSGDLRTLRERVSHLPTKGFIVTVVTGALGLLGALILFPAQIKALFGIA